jgi:nicotinate-nucleotide adenylyltransferase
MARKKLGIMGGTFDPIHNGHLLIAEHVQRELGLDKVLFIPAFVAPHKIGEEFARAEDRYHMTELAIAGHKNFFVSDMELKRQGISYTYDTLCALSEQYGSEYELYFIIGADSVGELGAWHNIRGIMNLCTFVAATRPGFVPPPEAVQKLYNDKDEPAIIWVSNKDIAISSTDIRARVQQKLDIKDLVPSAVAEYILQKDLYR